MRRPGFICLLLAVITLVVFLPVARHGFVNYDDSDYVTQNAHVQSGLRWANVVWAFTTGHASNWHPVTWLSHMLDCQLFGLNAGPQHLVSAGFHAANTVLLFLLLLRMTGALWRSALVAALFALHPLHVESVAWVSERKDVLSAFFFLLTVGAYVRYAEAQSSKWSGGATARQEAKAQGPGSAVTHHVHPPQCCYGGRASRITFHASRITPHASHYYILALFLFALGLMSKPMLVTLPFVLLLLDYWPLQRLRAGLRNGGPGSSRRKEAQMSSGSGHSVSDQSLLTSAATFSEQALRPLTLWRLLAEKAPFFLLVVGSSLVTFVVQRKGGAVSTSLSFGARVANALVSYVRYIGKLFWPENLSVLYPHPGHWPAWAVIASAALLLAVSAAVFVLGRRRPYLVVGWLWFCGMLIPVIGLVQVGVQSMADRYTYLPLIGLLIMVVWGCDDLIPARPWRVKVCATGAALSLATCALLTEHQLSFWRDSETLFSHAVKVTRDNYLAYNNLGFYLSGLGKTAEAMENYRKSLKINPAYEDALNNLGYALAGQKKYAEAIPLYEAALRIKPGHVEVENNLGNALSETGQIDEAIKHYLIALKQQPDHADANNNLGIALAMKGRLDEAIIHFQRAIRSNPKYASAHSNLGNAFAVQHKLDQAIKEYEESLRLKPDDAQAHNNLGNALAEQGNVGEAIENYKEALRLNADNPEAHFNLALALLRQGKREEAAAHLAEALQLRPNYPEARRQLELLKQQPPRP